MAVDSRLIVFSEYLSHQRDKIDGQTYEESANHSLPDPCVSARIGETNERCSHEQKNASSSRGAEDCAQPDRVGNRVFNLGKHDEANATSIRRT